LRNIKKTFKKYKKLLEQDNNVSEEEQNQFKRLESSFQIAELLVENKKKRNQSKEAKSRACYIFTMRQGKPNLVQLVELPPQRPVQ
jgi:hypothetical protein